MGRFGELEAAIMDVVWAAGDPAATLMRLVGNLEPGEAARLRAALDAAIDQDSPR